MDNEKAHRLARKRRRAYLAYRLAKLVLAPLLWFVWRPDVRGSEHVPATGPVIIAANHRSFWDSFFQALAVDRPLHWMAKEELFANPVAARLLIALGAFPVRRGASDQAAIETARQLLEDGRVVAVFPEGTRVRSGLGTPKRGVGRLSIETGAPLVPMAIDGTERLWRAIIGRPRLQLTLDEPVYPPAEPGEDAASELVNRRLWPRVSRLVLAHERQAALVASGVSALVWWRRRRRR